MSIWTRRVDAANGDADGAKGSPGVVTTVPSQRDSRIYALLFALLFLPYAYFDHSDGWNQNSRLAELHAVVVKHTMTIDAYHVFTGDKAFINGHFYSEKAPGVALLALPPFAVTVFAQRLRGIDPDAARPWIASAWIAKAGSVSVIAALAGLACFTLLRNRFTTRLSLLATVSVWLGTLAFPYATSFFSHALTMGLLTIALWAVLDSKRRSPGLDYLAGICAGFAVASDTQESSLQGVSGSTCCCAIAGACGASRSQCYPGCC